MTLPLTKPTSGVSRSGAVRETEIVGSLIDGQMGLYSNSDGLKLWIYGHSCGVEPGVKCTPGLEWFNRVKNKLGPAATVTTYAISGGKLVDSTFDAIGSLSDSIAGSTWVAGRKGVVFLHSFWNDYLNPNGVGAVMSANYLNQMVQSCRAFFVVISAAARVEATAGMATGTWSEAVNDAYSGGRTFGTATTGDHIDIPVTVPASGRLHVLMYGLGAEIAPVGNARVACGAVTVDTTPSDFIGEQYTRRSDETWFSVPVIVTLTGLTPGAGTVVVTRTGGTGSIYVDCVLVPSATPNPVVVVKEVPTKLGGFIPMTQPVLDQWHANKVMVEAALAPVIAEFPNVYVMESGVTLAGISDDDKTHQNDRGQAQFAANALWALKDIISDDSDALYATL